MSHNSSQAQCIQMRRCALQVKGYAQQASQANQAPLSSRLFSANSLHSFHNALRCRFYYLHFYTKGIFNILPFEVSSSNTFSPSLITVSGTNRHSQPSVLSDKDLITSPACQESCNCNCLAKKSVFHRDNVYVYALFLKQPVRKFLEIRIK